jgi:hypothetical protein
MHYAVLLIFTKAIIFHLNSAGFQCLQEIGSGELEERVPLLHGQCHQQSVR